MIKFILRSKRFNFSTKSDNLRHLIDNFDQ